MIFYGSDTCTGLSYASTLEEAKAGFLKHFGFAQVGGHFYDIPEGVGPSGWPSDPTGRFSIVHDGDDRSVEVLPP